jgi:hypothetical protein
MKKLVLTIPMGFMLVNKQQSNNNNNNNNNNMHLGHSLSVRDAETRFLSFHV